MTCSNVLKFFPQYSQLFFLKKVKLWKWNIPNWMAYQYLYYYRTFNFFE